MVRNLTDSYMEIGIAFFGLFRAIIGVLVRFGVQKYKESSLYLGTVQS